MLDICYEVIIKINFKFQLTKLALIIVCDIIGNAFYKILLGIYYFTNIILYTIGNISYKILNEIYYFIVRFKSMNNIYILCLDGILG